jgi:hypothetical protein
MHKRILFCLSAAALAAPFTALAHEHQIFEIGGKTYEFVVGSLNEPIAVDDRTGVHLSVTETGAGTAVEMEEGAGAVTGLETTLKVEIGAGGKKKELALSPVYGEAGAYRANFIPTIQTTYTYRFFGTINNTPVDLTFTCNPAGHPASEPDETRTDVSSGVVRTLKRGSYGCPVAKADLGFPEPSPSTHELRQAMGSGGIDAGMVGAILGTLGFVVGAAAWFKAGKRA